MALVSQENWALPALWLCWASYWVLAATRSTRRRRSESRRSRLVHLALLTSAFLLLFFEPLGIGPLAWQLLPANAAIHVLGGVMALTGLLFTVWARSHLGNSWSAAIAVGAGQQLVRSGPYAFVRHPIYSGLICAIAGTAVADGEVRAALGVAIAVLAYSRKARVEEAWLLRRFGAEYEDYRRNVGALVPLLRDPPGR